MGRMIVSGGEVVDGTGAAPRRADLVLEDGLVREVVEPGSANAEGAERLDATDRLVTPGFVDVHTHYDGQATWDPTLAPSSWHGVTSVVMGNCGVGFAPVRPDRHQFLIELMEGVEDIPGSALADGITWKWESFPEYLDELARLPRMIDVAAQVPHGSIRAYVMDDRGTSEHHASRDEIDRMAAIARESVEAGAVGFATNRLPLHTSIHGDPVPGTFAHEDELLAMMRAVRETGKGLLQSVPAGAMGEDPSAPLREVELYRKVSLETGCVVTFSLAQIQTDPKHWEGVLAACEKANAEGARLVPQVAGRPAGLLMSWQTFHPFMASSSYAALSSLPIEERLVKLREPATRRAILDDTTGDDAGFNLLANSFDTTFSLADGPVYEPDVADSLAARAAREGVTSEALAYDLMCGADSGDDRAGFLHVWFSGYKGGSLDDIGEMMRHPETVVGLADGGAHCSMICDASLPSYVLEHWVRDRARGPRIPIEEAVRLLSRDPAELYGLQDRGTLEPGKRADVNVIDLPRVRLETPEIVHDLPTGAPRLVQRGEGFDATIVAGEVTWRDGKDTGARPGGLIRSR